MLYQWAWQEACDKARQRMIAEEKERRKIQEETEFWRGRWPPVVREVKQTYERKIEAEYEGIISVVRAEQECLARALNEWKHWEVEAKVEQ